MKSVLLIGLGRFGRHMAIKLQALGHDILAIDQNEARVNNALAIVTDAQIGDATDEAFIKTLGVRNFDLCVIAIGDDFQSSLEATSLIKDNGAPFVLARAATDVHAKFLLRNGADDVIYPAQLAARYAAVRYTTDNVLDYTLLDDDYAVCEVNVPEAWQGQSILELNVRGRYSISILLIKDAISGQTQTMPGPDHIFARGQTMLVMGLNKDLQKFLK